MSNHDVEVCCNYISLVYRKFWQCIIRDLKELNLTENQYISLVGIYNNEGTNQSFLSSILALDPGTMSKNLRTLEDCGYIYKVVDESNRRNFKIHLTKEGYKITKESLEVKEKILQKVFLNLKEQDVKTLNILLGMIKETIDVD